MTVIKTAMKRCFRAPQGGWIYALLLFIVTMIRGCSGHLLGRSLGCYTPSCLHQSCPTEEHSEERKMGRPACVNRGTWVLSGWSSRMAPCASPLSPTATQLLLSALTPPGSPRLSLSDLRTQLSTSVLHQGPAQEWPPITVKPSLISIGGHAHPFLNRK